MGEKVGLIGSENLLKFVRIFGYARLETREHILKFRYDRTGKSVANILPRIKRDSEALWIRKII